MSTDNIETASEVVDAAPPDATRVALATYHAVAAGIADLRARHEGVAYEVATFKGMEAAKAARLEIREVRFKIQRARDAAKKHLNELKGSVESRAETIIGQLQPLEDHIDGQIKAEEKRRADEKEARERAEREARDALMRRLEAIRSSPLNLLRASAATIFEEIERIAGIDPATFGEFAPAAERAIKETTQRLVDLRDVALATEAAEAERRAEAERLAAERAELERQQAAERAEQQRLLAEQRAEIEREQAELERRRAEMEAAERHRKEVAEAEERSKRLAEQIAARDRQAEAERIERAQREAREAAERREAEARAAQEKALADAREKVQGAANQMLIALVSVRDWNAPRGALPDWIDSQVQQALVAAGAPDALPAASTNKETV